MPDIITLGPLVAVTIFVLLSLITILKDCHKLRHKQKKYRNALFWLAFANLAMLLWALFHFFGDIYVTDPFRIEVIHYYFAHSFILISVCGLLLAVRAVCRLCRESK
ncbi:hypothetical protein ACFL6I_26465 [candidate division KSB1 bacterium]